MNLRRQNAQWTRLSSGARVVLLSLAVAVLAGPALADQAPSPGSSPPPPPGLTQPSDELERQAEAIGRSIMSPFCAGRTVSACPAAGPWREDIRRWVSEGVDANEIKRRLAERVPEHNLAGVPKNRLGWALPVGLGIGAIGILVFLLRYLVGPRAEKRGAVPAEPQVRAKSNAAPAGARTNGEDYDARLEQELETFEQ